MGTALDMAKRLKQQSLRQIAGEVAALNLTPVPHPLSLRELLKLFANLAKPEVPTNLINEWLYPTTSPTLSPIFSDFKWTDPGAKSFRYATRYHCRLLLSYGSGYVIINNDTDVWTTSTEQVFETPLNFDTDYKASVRAWNEWGQSEWAWIKLHTYSNPNPQPSPPPKPKPQPPPQNPSEIDFWNCDVDKLQALFWLLDESAPGSQWKSWTVDSGYNEAGSCGPGSSQPLTIPLTAGHQYFWAIVIPGGANCDGNTDPDGDCWVWGNNMPGDAPLTAGSGGKLPLQYPP